MVQQVWPSRYGLAGVAQQVWRSRCGLLAGCWLAAGWLLAGERLRSTRCAATDQQQYVLTHRRGTWLHIAVVRGYMLQGKRLGKVLVHGGCRTWLGRTLLLNPFYFAAEA